MHKKIVVKVGTGVMVDSSGKLDHKILKQLVSQMASLHKIGHDLILVSSGAVGAGREIASFKKEDPIIQKRMLAAVGQARLMEYYTHAFKKYGIKVAQILPLRADFHHREKYLTIRDTLERLMANRMISILNENDTLASADLCFSDNDNLAALTAVAVKAHHLVFLTDIKGLYDGDPQTNKNAKLIKEVPRITPEMKQKCSKRSGCLGLGGMINKLMSIEMATRACIKADICYGRAKNALIKAVHNQNPGTHFPALCSVDKSKYLGKKAWLAAGVVPTGTIMIDQGAYQALKQHKSLLAVGIKEILGEFNSSDVVTILNPQKIPVGTGMVHYSSGTLKSAKKFPKPVIHADDLVLW